MPLDEDGTAFRRQSIYLFFKLGFNVPGTVDHLSRGFEDITFNEVDSWFARFRTGSRDLDTDVVIDNNARDLESIPVNLKRKIMESVNVGDQQSLLTVNHSFREILQEDKRIYNEVKIVWAPNTMHLSLENKVTGTEIIKFTKNGERCEKKVGGKKMALPGSYIEEGIKRFKEAIEKKGTKINRLDILSDLDIVRKGTSDVEMLCSEVSKTIGGLNEKLHVEDLSIRLFKKEDLYTALDGIKVGALTDLHFNAPGEHLRYSFNECQSLEGHLANLKKLRAINASFDIPLEAFADIRYLSIFGEPRADPIDPGELKRYKEKLLETTGFLTHAFHGIHNRKDIRAALEPYKAIKFKKYDGILTAPGKESINFSLEVPAVRFEREGF